MLSPPYDSRKLYAALLELAVIDEKSLSNSLAESTQQNVPLGDVLIAKDLLAEPALGILVADLLGVSYINLTEVSIPSSVLQLIPETVARAQQAIAFKQDTTHLHIATTHTGTKVLWDFLQKKTGLQVKVYYTTPRALQYAFSLYSKNITQAFDEIIAASVAATQELETAQAPVTQIVDTIIGYAEQNEASDVHIEPLEKHTLVRFRVDGILRDIVRLPLDLNEQIVTRIKVMANLRTDEHQSAQDGKITSELQGRQLDIRVSIAPITRGEKIVMRLLSEKSRHFSLSDLGLSGDDLKKVAHAYTLPNGMVLSTGPTGSGKTTTLYSMLKLINTRDVNIMTIEDPVEYQIDTINQMQVNPKAELTFAKGLRSIVRQDPDVILVGEIRDEETANIAVNSAMTGHLVLSTLHTNDAATAFPRLIDMGIEPYLAASTLKVIIGQRLVRKICPKCKVSSELTTESLDVELRRHLGKSKKITVYKGKGCAVCADSGYLGRVGIFEVLELNDEIKEAILAKKSAGEISTLAIAHGMTTMLQDGISKIKQGVTTLEEVLRVTKES